MTLSPAALEQARARLTRECCPRRYCWYWHTLAFDWDIDPDQGCEVADRHAHRLILEHRSGQPVPAWQRCRRATGNPEHADYYETRVPHLAADGWAEDHFRIVGKVARMRRFERRERGRGRRGG